MPADSIKKISKQTQLNRLARRAILLLLMSACCFLFGSAEIAAQQLTNGTSGKQFKQASIESIPFDSLNQQTQAKLQPVLERPSIYRRLPQMAIKCDADYFRYLVRYPEVIVEIWKLMGVTKMDSKRASSWLVETNDGAGTFSQLELVYGNANQHIYYGTGSYEGALLKKKLTGRCVLVLKSTHGTDEAGNPTAVCQLDVYLKVDNIAAGVIARTLQSVVGSTADHNFIESLRFIEKLNKTTSYNGPGVQLMGERLTLEPEVLRGFQDVAGQTFLRSQRRTPAAEAPRVSSSVNAAGYQNR